MNAIRQSAWIWTIAASSVASNAQFAPQVGRLTPAQLTEILKNTGKLQVSMKLDRDVYFPGEEPGITITVQNPTTQVLEVLSPFQTGEINILVRDPSRLKSAGTEWRHLNPHPVGLEAPSLDAPSRWMNPGEKIQSDYSGSAEGCMDKKLGAAAYGRWFNCRFPISEGEYQIQYTYPQGAVANFSIVWPKLEQWAEVVLQKPSLVKEVDINLKPTGRTTIHKRRVRVAVLGYLGSHILIVSATEFSGDPYVDFHPGDMFTGSLSWHFAIHRRLVTIAEPVTALQATADSAENVTITYTEQGGQKFTLKLDPNRHIIP